MDPRFQAELRKALNHLYDPDVLEHSPLGEWLGIGGVHLKPVRLQQLLEAAIAEMKPGLFSAQEAWKLRISQFLTYRYLQQLSQKEIAFQLGVSLSKLAREQRLALSALGLHLWDKYAVSARMPALAEDKPPGVDPAAELELPCPDEDLEWMKTSGPGAAASLSQILNEAVGLSGPLMSRYKIRLEIDPKASQYRPAVNAVLLRQILLSLINASLHFAAGGKMEFSIQDRGEHILLQIVGASLPPGSPPTPEGWEGCLQVAEKLVGLSGGSLIHRTEGHKLAIELSLPIIQPIPILVIDDSPDSLQLFQRYAENTHFGIYGLPDPQEAVEGAVRSEARLVVLDIMMPGVDGWTILQDLRSDPRTAHLPVVICTILPLEELALSLGADAYLSKPVSQADFLAALDKLANPAA